MPELKIGKAIICLEEIDSSIKSMPNEICLKNES